MKKLIKIDRNGTKYYEGDVPCERCGGAGGADKWKPTGWKCYKCGGTGTQWGRWKEYTPEYEAKLAEQRRKRREKWEAEHAEEIAARKAEQERKEAEQKAEQERREREEAERKARSQHIGKAGDRIELEVTYERTATFQRQSFRGFGTETAAIHTFRDNDGNVLTWTTTRALGKWISDTEWQDYEEGAKLTIKATIKEHSEYKGEKQTKVIRVKVKE